MSTARTLTTGAVAGVVVGYARTALATSATTTNVIPADNTIPQSGEGAELSALNTTYTPRYASSLLEVEVSIPYASHSGTVTPILALFRDSGADAIFAAFANTPAAGNAILAVPPLRVVVAAGSTAATTFKLRFGTASGTTRLNSNGSDFLGAVDLMVMTVKEIAQ